MKLLSTKDAAKKLGVSDRRVRAMIQDGKLTAVQVGSGYVIEENALQSVQTYGKAGRPKKSNGIEAKEIKK